MKSLVFAVLVAWLCGQTAYILIQRSTNGSGTAWETLPALPKRAEHIARASGENVVIQTDDKTYYICSFFGNRLCWGALNPDQIKALYPGTPWQPSSSLAPPPVSSFAEIKYGSSIYAEVGVSAAYAIQNDGTVLAWRHGGDSYSVLLFLILPACAGVAGFFSSMVLALLMWLLSKRYSTPRPLPARLALNGLDLARTVPDLKWIIFALLMGLCFWEAAYIYVLPRTNGSRIPWQALTAPPKPVLAIRQLSGSQVTVESTDHTYYACEFVTLKFCWQPIGPEVLGHPLNTTIWQPTSDFAPAVLFWLGPAEAVFVADHSAAQVDILAAAAIKNNGDVAVWRTTSNPYLNLARWLLPLCAGIVGLLLNVALAAIVRLRPKMKPSVKAPMLL